MVEVLLQWLEEVLVRPGNAAESQEVAMEAIGQFFGCLFVAISVLVFPLYDLVSQLMRAMSVLGATGGAGVSWVRVCSVGRYVCR